jgi:two-component system response regulator ChvI
LERFPAFRLMSHP